MGDCWKVESCLRIPTVCSDINRGSVGGFILRTLKNMGLGLGDDSKDEV